MSSKKENIKKIHPELLPIGVRKHVSWKPGTMINPLPAVMISCGDTEEEYNILTVS